ncbi:MurR/RpiR family transcriptional regulator [Salipaludibacillus agaradhaerens]|jgi:DNA-binding MurR/RpiR family transcriptional regulator|uniref:MurR/RpiR family transcriptional regulator n=1 Tax=Salipaludibacillus agaradhaerens TaxID=76935 RepID=A0A9Q4G0T3_SALAG|nr:MurR/RpiR family transcriptional regulator [Salipaludibacillus agaradhaerens]MCR6109050.1 MurR/RpiR family transcriptional regulator [Bacillus sp. A301a_S52]UJW56239.1 MurR/RpiR family transcriptional regulator [Bacillus sp. A116_S68]MCR6098149.1 MurR/RpiR family transcriptional regulator [Salipaludibacillus agaradhaerens]MCR6105003.1 MurR/RpiR family transcriptional regulator [Salipaludibacillus agaradhaerens]MCR6116221.1 MurR/RpiR family transcriptional regulator [Salipaludibacillus agara
MEQLLFNIPRETFERLSETERYLLTYIHDHLDDIATMSIVTLSERAAVSTATIVRLMKKIGYKGYTSFKYRLEQDKQMIDKEGSLSGIDHAIKQALHKNEEEVQRTIQLQSIGQIEDAVQKMHDAKKIYIFARGFSQLIAHEMAVKLQVLDKTCEMHDDPNIIRIKSRKMNHQTDLAIFISLNGETGELVEACQNLTIRQVTTITLTTKAHSSLNRLSDITLLGYRSDKSAIPEYEVRSRLALNVIARVLLDAYVIRTNENVKPSQES